MLMSRLSSLRHKTRYAYVYAYVVVRTRLKALKLLLLVSIIQNRKQNKKYMDKYGAHLTKQIA